jgi:hypothetical protein
MSYDMHPSTIPKQVDGFVIPDACAGALPMAVQLALADYLAERCGVQ